MAFKSNLKSLQSRRTQYQERIKLVSGGYIKPDAFPGGEITVYPWDSNIDDWFTERLRKGNRDTVMFDLCEQLCDLNGCPLDSFLMGDVDTILLVARANRYGGIVEYSYVCPSCGHQMEDNIQVPEMLETISPKAQDYPGYDEITLPDCLDVIRVRPLQIKDEKIIMERDKTSKALMTDRVMHVLMPIVTINDGKPDAWEDAVRWYNALSPLDAQCLEDKENELYPHLNTALPHQCDQCRKQFKHKLDFNTEFFRASLKPGSGTSLAPDVQSSLGLKGAGNQPQGGAGPNPGSHGKVGQ